MIKNILNSLSYRYAKSSSSRYVKWLRKRGCLIGDRVEFHGLSDISIDTTRPSLVEIGNDVIFTRGVTLLTHGYDWFVLRNIFDEVIASSGKVKIGNNVFLGARCIILKSVSIGDNVIIGAGSVVTRDVPSNSVAVGNPARVVMPIQEYYKKRKTEYVDEALAYAKSIKESLGRQPVPADFWEEFPLFLRPDESVEGVPIEKQLGGSVEFYRKNNIPIFKDFSDFLDKAGVGSKNDR
ncbi:hypothetical protein GCM10010960_05300 [Arenimonas maotaiensis]|uniref:Acetyltransferase n=1 Tax=Arenimonas maotaiensis TaxID=1446479 RepID=A0A917CHV8_9GAMM|nr:hypothetical protein GCM10010960_05300 [Arenimonas maotaiensis]